MSDVSKLGVAKREIDKSVVSKLKFIVGISPKFNVGVADSVLVESLVVVPILNVVITTVFYPWFLYVSIKFSICVYPVLSPNWREVIKRK